MVAGIAAVAIPTVVYDVIVPEPALSISSAGALRPGTAVYVAAMPGDSTVDVKVWPPSVTVAVGETVQLYAAVLKNDSSVYCTDADQIGPVPVLWIAETDTALGAAHAAPWNHPAECDSAAALLDYGAIVPPPAADSVVIIEHVDTIRSELVVDGQVVATHLTVIAHSDTVVCPVCVPTPPPLPTAPPAYPSNLTRTQTPVSIDLAWVDNADNETGFEVWRQIESGVGPWTLRATLGADAVAYSDASGLIVGTEYCYRVRAFNVVGPSGWSNVACKRFFP